MSFLANKTKQTINKQVGEEQHYVELQQLYYDYNQLKDKQLAKWLSNCTIEIRGRQYKSMKEVYQMGKLLNQVKERVGYGFYKDWLTKELIEPGIFGVSTAENYCSVANAVEKFGYDKLKYFAVSAIYIAGKARDEIDEEFQKYIFDEGEKRYISTGESVTKAEVLAEKRRFKAIKSSDLPEEQQKELIESHVPIEVVNQIIKHKDPEVKAKLADQIITSHKPTKLETEVSTESVTITINATKKIDYIDRYSVLSDIDYDLAFIQHSLDREGGDLDDIVQLVKDKVKTIVLITLPLDSYIINIPNNFTVKNLIFMRRPRHRLWSEINTINHLFCATILTNDTQPNFPLDDYFDSADQGIEYIFKAFNTKKEDARVVFTRSDAEVVSFNLFTENLITRLSELTISPIYVIN